MNIYVGNLAFNVTEGELKQAFEDFGEVTSAKIIKDKYSGESKGFGFVEMSDGTEAQAAIKGLNEKELIEYIAKSLVDQPDAVKVAVLFLK